MDKVTLTKEQALSVIAPGDKVHTFRQAGYMLLGADIPLTRLEELIAENVCEIGSWSHRDLDHGLMINYQGQLYVATKVGLDWDAIAEASAELQAEQQAEQRRQAKKAKPDVKPTKRRRKAREA